jgi:hypothetical protein
VESEVLLFQARGEERFGGERLRVVSRKEGRRDLQRGEGEWGSDGVRERQTVGGSRD